ncbi:MAG: hypothetical protein LBT00_13250 [Spirochaetaceae bacterium]|nr:hypothetical protein [Spirochaetaceae bacterium]
MRGAATKQSRRRRPFQAQREALSRLLARSNERLARNDGRNCRHCEEHGDEAIQTGKALPSSTRSVEPIASLRSQ